MQFTKEQLIAKLQHRLTVAAKYPEVEEAELDAAIFKIALASLEAGSDSNSHPAHGPLTTERLHQLRDAFLRTLQYSNGGNMNYIIADAVKAIAELIAARKAEPVADVVSWASPNEERTCDIRWRRHDVAAGPLYTTPPSPVTIDERAAFNAWNNEDNLPIAGVGAKNAAWLAWQARAKLGSPPAPVEPATLPCAVELKPGLIIGKGCKTETLLTALQRRADYCAEIVAMTPEERAEHDANIEAFKAMLPQPAPLTVQCWSCRDEIEVSAIGDCDGYCPKCNSPIDLDEEPYTAPPAPVVPENCVTAEHRRVIEMLLNVCGAAFELADDSCQQDVDGEECHVVPDDAFQKLSDALDEIENTLPTEDVDRPDVFLAWSAMPRAALKSILQAGNSPVTPDGYVLVPKKLTAENGAKSVLSGEFSETKFINCPECFGDDECETCDGSGRIEITVPVTWTTIKEIWAKGAEHFAAAQQKLIPTTSNDI